jgi:hypothetical protein
VILEQKKLGDVTVSVIIDFSVEMIFRLWVGHASTSLTTTITTYLGERNRVVCSVQHSQQKQHMTQTGKIGEKTLDLMETGNLFTAFTLPPKVDRTSQTNVRSECSAGQLRHYANRSRRCLR